MPGRLTRHLECYTSVKLRGEDDYKHVDMNVDKVRRRPPREVGGGLQRVVDDWGGRDDKTSKAVEVKSHVTSRGGEAASKSSVNASDGAPWRRYSLPRQPYPDLREGALLPLVLCCHIPGFTECDLHAWVT